MFQNFFSSISKFRRLAINSYLDLLFPPFCRYCRSEHERPGNPLCAHCEAHVEWIHFRCLLCGAPVLNPGKGEKCIECRGRRLYFDSNNSLALYSGVIRDLILQFKKPNDPEILNYFSELISGFIHQNSAVRLLKNSNAPRREVILVPIPTRFFKRVLKGDPAMEMLTQSIGKRLGFQVKNLLKRSRNVSKQSELNRESRIKNQSKVFVVRKAVPKNSSVILIDDVVTTCATISDAARALKKAGASSVHVYSVARSI